MVKRVNIPEKVKTAILTKSARRFPLCFCLTNDESEKKGQIAHIDRNPANVNEDNLVYLCLDHHDSYDSTTSQSKGFTPLELRDYRDRLYAWVIDGMPRRSESPSPTREQLSLEEIMGEIGPKVLTIMNVAVSPADLSALRLDMKSYHERLEALAVLFAREPDTRKAIIDLGQAGGAAVSMSPNVMLQLFEKFDTAMAVLEAALAKRIRVSEVRSNGIEG